MNAGLSYLILSVFSLTVLLLGCFQFQNKYIHERGFEKSTILNYRKNVPYANAVPNTYRPRSSMEINRMDLNPSKRSARILSEDEIIESSAADNHESSAFRHWDQRTPMKKSNNISSIPTISYAKYEEMVPPVFINGTLYQMTLPISIPPSGPLFSDHSPLQNNPELIDNGTRRIRQDVSLVDLLKAINKKNDIMITVTDSGYVSALMNMFANSKLWKYPNFLIFAFDDNSFYSLRKRGFVVYKYNTNRVTDAELKSPAKYGSTRFSKKVQVKLDVIHDCMKLGYGVLYVDNDLVLLENPFPAIHKAEGSCLSVSQNDVFSPCFGFIYFRSLPLALELVERTLNYSVQYNLLNQGAFVKLLSDYPDRYKNCFLDERLYLSGEHYWHTFPFYNSTHNVYNSGVHLIHNNYVAGFHNKMYRLKEQLLYGFDSRQYYSNSTAKYVHLLNSYATKQDLFLLFSLAARLNRIAVLPQFRCGSGVNKQLCNLCHRGSYHCFDDYLKCFSWPYRENSFFHNKLVPLDIRVEGLSNPIVSMDESFLGFKTNSESVLLEPHVNNMNELVLKMKEYDHMRVIRLDSFGNSMYFYEMDEWRYFLNECGYHEKR